MEQGKCCDYPLISVIMPAYNAEKYIGRAIESVLNQSYKNVELVIGNDASTDMTCEIVKGYNDKRIILCHEKKNTGSAYLPRQHAFENCKGNIVVALDSDDFLEENYIEELYNRMNECEADVCLGKMLFVDEKGVVLGKDQNVPHLGFDYSVQMSGREAYFFTIPEWRIGLNGCMAKKECWKYAFDRTYKSGKRGIHDDENVSRYLLLHASKVVFNESIHYYTINSKSVTHVFNNTIFDWLNTEDDLLGLIGEDYGINSSEYKAVERYNYNCFLGAFSCFVKSLKNINDDELTGYIKKFKIWHDRINWKEVKTYIDRCHYLINRHYYIEFIIYMLRYRQMKGIIIVGKKVIKSRFTKIINNKYYKWYIYRKKREKFFLNSILEKYGMIEVEEKNFPAYVINIIDGTVQGGGLADRLRGIICTYAICKEKNLPYRLFFTYPFNLEDYFVPNQYDWSIEEGNICRKYRKCKIVILDSTEDSAYQFKMQESYLKHKLKITNKQTQVFTNAGFAYNLDYAALFKELFKPSERLQKAIDEQREILGCDYISVSARFLDLLGDFNETFGYGKRLTDCEAEDLIKISMDRIIELHGKFPKSKILVNSDSSRFIKATLKLEYTYSIPGTITHIDNKNLENNYERYEKTFLDFMMIAEADKIFLLKSGKMFKSGYPYAASKIHNKEFIIIEY